MDEIFHNQSYLEIAQPYRFQWEPVQERYILLYPEGMIQLNHTAGDILNRCCLQEKTIGQTIAELEAEFDDQTSTDIKDDVYEFLKAAYENRWIRARRP